MDNSRYGKRLCNSTSGVWSVNDLLKLMVSTWRSPFLPSRAEIFSRLLISGGRSFVEFSICDLGISLSGDGVDTVSFGFVA